MDLEGLGLFFLFMAAVGLVSALIPYNDCRPPNKP